jgi:ketosteroid isomerase-like protein
MSQENVEILRQINAAANEHDLAAVAASYAPDIEWRDLQHGPDVPEVVHGIEAVKQLWSDWLDVIPDLRIDISEYIDLGDTIVCPTRWHGRGAGSGAPVDLHVVDVYELADGKVVRATFGYESKADALKAVEQYESRSAT